MPSSPQIERKQTINIDQNSGNITHHTENTDSVSEQIGLSIKNYNIVEHIDSTDRELKSNILKPEPSIDAVRQLGYKIVKTENGKFENSSHDVKSSGNQIKNKSQEIKSETFYFSTDDEFGATKLEKEAYFKRQKSLPILKRGTSPKHDKRVRIDSDKGNKSSLQQLTPSRNYILRKDIWSKIPKSPIAMDTSDHFSKSQFYSQQPKGTLSPRLQRTFISEFQKSGNSGSQRTDVPVWVDIPKSPNFHYKRTYKTGHNRSQSPTKTVHTLAPPCPMPKSASNQKLLESSSNVRLTPYQKRKVYQSGLIRGDSSDTISSESVNILPESVNIRHKSIHMPPESVNIRHKSIHMPPESVNIRHKSIHMPPESVNTTSSLAPMKSTSVHSTNHHISSPHTRKKLSVSQDGETHRHHVTPITRRRFTEAVFENDGNQNVTNQEPLYSNFSSSNRSISNSNHDQILIADSKKKGSKTDVVDSWFNDDLKYGKNHHKTGVCSTYQLAYISVGKC
ncbi:unnamed protein product [Owenia fusiformis]|uniref:Uncharacterized protein n=1 Tax=Owenia fusiformis TaxID=6347 RepID=A0A8J1UXR5_OWEFU|nr:unnamed protein product [Owenia fusiformis]